MAYQGREKSLTGFVVDILFVTHMNACTCACRHCRVSLQYALALLQCDCPANMLRTYGATGMELQAPLLRGHNSSFERVLTCHLQRV